MCIYLFQASRHYLPPTQPTPLLHTYVIWRIARWHYPVQLGCSNFALVYDMHVRLLSPMCLRCSGVNPICTECIFLFAKGLSIKKSLEMQDAFPLLIDNEHENKYNFEKLFSDSIHYAPALNRAAKMFTPAGENKVLCKTLHYAFCCSLLQSRR